MLSGIITAILLGSFLAGTAWAWSGRRREEFDRAAHLPLDEPPTLRERRSVAVDAAGDSAAGGRT